MVLREFLIALLSSRTEVCVRNQLNQLLGFALIILFCVTHSPPTTIFDMSLQKAYVKRYV